MAHEPLCNTMQTFTTVIHCTLYIHTILSIFQLLLALCINNCVYEISVYELLCKSGYAIESSGSVYSEIPQTITPTGAETMLEARLFSPHLVIASPSRPHAPITTSGLHARSAIATHIECVCITLYSISEYIVRTCTVQRSDCRL